MAQKAEGLLTDEGGGPVAQEGSALDHAESSLPDSEDLRGLIVQGRERGYLTFEEISAALEEVEVTKEQVRDLHAYLI